MRMTISATTVTFDLDRYLLAVRDEIRRVFIEAGRKFLLVAIPRIHIWTGMLRGAFRNAEDIFGKVSLDAQSPSGYRIRGTRGGGTGGVAGAKQGTYYYYPPAGSRVLRTPEAGRDFSTSENEILNPRLVQSRYGLLFRYRINLTYYDYLDQSWGSFKAGQDAFIDRAAAAGSRNQRPDRETSCQS